MLTGQQEHRNSIPEHKQLHLCYCSPDRADSNRFSNCKALLSLYSLLLTVMSAHLLIYSPVVLLSVMLRIHPNPPAKLICILTLYLMDSLARLDMGLTTCFLFRMTEPFSKLQDEFISGLSRLGLSLGASLDLTSAEQSQVMTHMFSSPDTSMPPQPLTASNLVERINILAPP